MVFKCSFQECMQILEKVYNHAISDPFRHEVKSKDVSFSTMAFYSKLLL